MSAKRRPLGPDALHTCFGHSQRILGLLDQLAGVLVTRNPRATQSGLAVTTPQKNGRRYGAHACRNPFVRPNTRPTNDCHICFPATSKVPKPLSISLCTRILLFVRPKDRSKLERLFYSSRSFVPKLAIWFTGLTAPEVLVGAALRELQLAHEDVMFMRRHGFPQWTHKHAFFALMDGVKWTDGRCVSSGKDLYDMDTSDTKSAIKNLDYQALLNDIDDKSKTDALGRILAVLQVTRFHIGTIARAIQHLPISPLEYITCSAYVICALMMYGVWFHKPYNVQQALYVDLGRTYVADLEASPQELPAETGAQGFSQMSFKLLVYLLCALSLLIVGAGHLASWDIQFPTTYGQPLWRVCSISITVSPVVGALCFGMVKFCSMNTAALLVTSWLLLFASVQMRFFLLFLMVYSFYSLPAGVYDMTDISWPNYFPFLH